MAESTPPQMPPPPVLTFTPPSPTTARSETTTSRSDQSDAAQTVADTVMAEQISHHVVENSESAGGSLPVDAAVNQPTTPAAHYGSTDRPVAETKTANEQANDANAALTSTPQATASAAEPSAGSATGNVAGAPAIVVGMDAKGDRQEQMVNGVGESAQLGEGTADDVSVQGSADLSLQSDNEGSRGENSEQKNEDKHHARTNSVKKPTTFSRVSVTKNFLAKSNSPAPVASKLGEKPSAAGAQTPTSSVLKPRLIAKTGASLRDVQKARPGAEATGGPDASKVWNKNRPVPLPPPKQFTDEELKQQFGIHMTARLQSDEMGKEAKWADIDDEEDDWAPEAVVWMDGTKSNLNAQEAALPQEEQKTMPPPSSKPGEGAKPKLAVRKPLELGPQKTILKPGAGAAAAQARQNGAGAGTPADRPLLKAKDPTTAPSKSPWAVLPPVERVSPVTPPVQQLSQPPPMMSQDARAYEPAPPSMPAREIRADTFDRSWRDGEGAPRELFNASNGRYEPAPEGRRASRPEASYRKPAVLQRPSHGAPPPAEPSSAFQTRTAAQMDGHGPRRRGSSVSQSSAPSARRVSMSKPQDGMAGDRRPSVTVGNDMRSSPKLARTDLAQPPVFAQQSAWQQQMPPQPEEGGEPVEDPVVAQARIMKEKRELAKKRRQDEEAAEEAKKKERLAQRLATMSGAGKSRKDREAEAAALVAAPAPATPARTTPATEIPSQPHFIASNNGQAPPEQSADSTTMVTPTPQTLPPQHAPSLAKPQHSPHETTIASPFPTKPLPQGDAERSIAPSDQTQRQQTRTHLSPRAGARHPYQSQSQPQQSAAYRAPASSYSSPGDRKQQLLGRSPHQTSDTFTPWPISAPNGNVWGTSGIGNGTFESTSSFAPIPMSQQSSSLPPPPGMSGITRPSTSTRISPQGLGQESRSPSLQQQSVAEPGHRGGFAPPGLDAFGPHARGNGTSPAPGLGRQTHLPGPIAPPSRAQQQSQAQQPPRPDPMAAWNNAAARLPYEHKNPPPPLPVQKKQDAGPPREEMIKETFKKTSTVQGGKLGGPRKFDTVEHTVYSGAGPAASKSPAPPVAQTQPAGPFSTASPLQQDDQKTASGNTVRIPDGSLNPAHGGSQAQQQPIGPPTQQRAAPSTPNRALNFPSGPLPPVGPVNYQSPPPAETSDHPAYSGDVSRPVVRLPSMLMKPVVKLPPAPTQQPAPGQQPNQVSLPHRPVSNWGAPHSAMPLVKQSEWQERFNGLFSRAAIHTETPPSPPRTPPKMQVPAAAVTANSRTSMSEAPTATNAIVSLPHKSASAMAKSSEGFTIDDSQDVTSKSMIEDMFKAELSFGSLPKVAVPKSPRYSVQVSKAPAKDVLNMPSNSRFVKPAESQSTPVFAMRDVHPPSHNGVYIHLTQLRNPRGKMVYYASRKPGNRANNGNRVGARGGKETGAVSAGGENNKAGVQKAGSEGATAGEGTGARKSSGWAKPPRGGNARKLPPATPS